ncbi:helicase [Candidatus Uhrbacteria bacterium CG_4_9_14_3_um_filter_41_35]|uniref:Helicase n=1 Tax=Candidatus Uhrbacteria bacterium CG_4_9_14_3_um_filter_41_35 TaxID=1975034 RepID=A0A2M7XFG7_9BACT|nr:MAG: helicase [Candidatus Uhrbacteria bacterium CG11_big_fil_rev_8_21_14_0_20_41_9]PJA46613.1 MAG: helicase [Candidatus Uhrbacteria bacterium CG_4_9_14_3_um_filter_41_35]
MNNEVSNEVVLDIETSNTFQDVGGYFPEKLDVSVVVAYYYATDEYESYLVEDLPKLFERLERNGRIIGYNTIGFDIPVLNKYYVGDLMNIPQCDMLAHIHQSLGYRIKLDDVAVASIGIKKSAHGLLAVQWWREGKVQEVINYCQQDVKVTKEVYEFGKRNGYVLFDDRTGQRRQVNIDFAEVKEEKPVINLSMGF